MVGKKHAHVTELLDELRNERDDDIWDAAMSFLNVGTKLQLRPDQRPVRKSKPRLDRDDYVGQRTYHITLATARRAPFFEYRSDAKPLEVTLIDVAARFRFGLLAYCFMPDQLHVLLLGQKPDSNLLLFVQCFKQITSFHFKQKKGDALWQQSFYDRILRQNDDLSKVAQYVLDNPSVEGLAPGSAAYELRGGSYFDEGLSDGAEASSLHLPLLREESP
jgi:putative transposase